jgi:hypothetical protein
MTLGLVGQFSATIVPVKADPQMRMVYGIYDNGMTNWSSGRCGHAAVATVLNFYVGYRAITDDDVAAYIGDHWYGLTLGQVVDAADHFARVFGLRGLAWSESGLDMYTVMNEINANRPVIVHITTWQGGHWSVIVGYRWDNNANDFKIWIYERGAFESPIVIDIVVVNFSGSGGAGGGW